MDEDKNIVRNHLRVKINRYKSEALEITGTDEASQRRLSLLNYKISAYQNRLSELNRHSHEYGEPGKTLWGTDIY
ncbi:MAG: hypothetical protein PHQ65_11985 [Bacteroidales bacterium]|nr:hypothetical protein [Bacteroidales bacterium]